MGMPDPQHGPGGWTEAVGEEGLADHDSRYTPCDVPLCVYQIGTPVAQSWPGLPSVCTVVWTVSATCRSVPRASAPDPTATGELTHIFRNLQWLVTSRLMCVFSVLSPV